MYQISKTPLSNLAIVKITLVVVPDYSDDLLCHKRYAPYPTAAVAATGTTIGAAAAMAGTAAAVSGAATVVATCPTAVSPALILAAATPLLLPVAAMVTALPLITPAVNAAIFPQFVSHLKITTSPAALAGAGKIVKALVTTSNVTKHIAINLLAF